MDIIKDFLAMMWWFFLILFGAILVAVNTDTSASDAARKAIEQCEAELPRHLHCDYCIEAFVVEGE